MSDHSIDFFVDPSNQGDFDSPSSPSCQNNLSFFGQLNAPEPHPHAQQQDINHDGWPRLTLRQEPIRESPITIKMKAKGISKNQKLNGKCKCTKNNCKKNYCECFRAGRICSKECGCIGCKNDSHTFIPMLSCTIEQAMDIGYDLKHKIRRR